MQSFHEQNDTVNASQVEMTDSPFKMKEVKKVINQNSQSTNALANTKIQIGQSNLGTLY
jgi:hypothetical protein